MSLKADERFWIDFVAWCQARRLSPLPAHPWTVAAYARWLESRHRLPTIGRRIRAIGRKHLLTNHPPPDREPTVTRTLRRIESQGRPPSRRARSVLGDGDPESPGTAVPEPKPEPEPEPPSRRTKAHRVLRSTPRLVARRPGGASS